MYWRAPNWIQYFIFDLTRAEEGTRFTSLKLLAVLLLIQPSMQMAFIAARVHCWLLQFNWFSSWKPRSCILQSCILASWNQDCSPAWVYFIPDAEVCIYQSWTSFSSCHPFSLACVIFWTAPPPSSLSSGRYCPEMYGKCTMYKHPLC